MKELELTSIGERCYFETLPNGLTVYVVPKTGYAKTHAFLAVSYGGADECFSVGNRRRQTPAGVAHFLEHKMFDMPEGNALQLFSARGAAPNAFTASDLTGYYFSCTDQFYDNLRTLLTFVTTPYFTEESVAKEQGIIGQEIRMLEDLPGWQCYQAMLQGLYYHHPVRNNIAGSVESIAQITAETLQLCYKTFYRPENMVLCVAGNVEPRQVLQLAASVVPGGEKLSVTKDRGDAEPSVSREQEVTQFMEVSAAQFMLGFKAKPQTTLRDKLLGDLVAQMLCGSSTPLYAKLYDSGLINSGFEAEFDCCNEQACLVFSGESRDPAAVAEEILSEGVRIAWNGLDEQLFRRVKKADYGSRVRALNSFEHICVQIARGHFEGYQYLEFAKEYDSISVADVVEFIRDTITGERSTLSIVRPKGVNE